MTTKRYHKIDGWRGYPVPALAIVGASDTGAWDDSPCPSNEVKAELRRASDTARMCFAPSAGY
jgi:hypothetical protein